jgi:hypothetical protein
MGLEPTANERLFCSHILIVNPLLEPTPVTPVKLYGFPFFLDFLADFPIIPERFYLRYRKERQPMEP